MQSNPNAINANQNLSAVEKIAMLEEIHRPLHDHWNVITTYDLDPKSSDSKYKHHISRMEDIYCNRKYEIKQPPTMLTKSAVSLLHGVNGLYDATNVDPAARQKSREDKWVSNFQKYNYLKDPTMTDISYQAPPGAKRSDSQSPRKDHSRYTSSSSAIKSGHQFHHSTNRTEPLYQNDSHKRKYGDTGDQTDGQPFRNVHSRCYDQNCSEEDLILLGVYSLNEQQEKIYKDFVEMLSAFDSYDQTKVLADALKDAQQGDLLQLYGGTEL